MEIRLSKKRVLQGGITAAGAKPFRDNMPKAAATRSTHLFTQDHGASTRYSSLQAKLTAERSNQLSQLLAISTRS